MCRDRQGQTQTHEDAEYINTDFTNRYPLATAKNKCLNTRADTEGHALTELSLNNTLTRRQGPGVHLDAQANSDPHLYRLKLTGAESGRHTRTHRHSFIQVHKCRL